MLMFTLGVGALLIGGMILFLQGFKLRRVKILSILGVVMIIINLLNEIDVSLHPVQLYKRQVNERQRDTKSMIQLKREIRFSSKIQLTELRYYHKLLVDYKLQRMGVPTLSQSQMLERLRLKLLRQQQDILHIPMIEKQRMQVLFMHYINEKNSININKNKNYQNIVGVIIYNQQQQLNYHSMVSVRTVGDKSNTADENTTSNNNNDGIMGRDSYRNSQYYLQQQLYLSHFQHKISYHLDYSTIDFHNHHYILVTDTPTQSILDFLYSIFIQKQINCTIIFTSLPSHINAFPISQFIETIDVDFENKLQKEYFQLITNQLMQKGPNVSSSVVQQQLELCQKYSQIDYKLYLLIMSDRTKQPLQICFQRTLIKPQPQIQCLIKMMQSPTEQLSYHRGRRCFRIKSYIPQSVIVTTQGKLRVKKQHYWHNKLTAEEIGLLISNIESTSTEL